MSNVADKGQMPMWECYDHGSFDGEWNEVTPWNAIVVQLFFLFTTVTIETVVDHGLRWRSCTVRNVKRLSVVNEEFDDR